MDGADRLLEPRARRRGVRRAADVAPARPARQAGQRLLLGAFAMTACWAWLHAIDAGQPLVGYAETARNLVWVGLLYSLSARSDARQHGVRLVYGAVAAVLGLQLVVATLSLIRRQAARCSQTAILLRITAAAGALVLVHNLYGQAAPASRLDDPLRDARPGR